MPFSPSQHRLWQAAARDPSIARKHGISQSKARRFAAEGVKKARGGLAYAADGGEQEVRESDLGWEEALAGAGLGAAGALGYLAKFAPGKLNRLARPIQRRFAPTHFGVESLSKDELSLLKQRIKLATARERARSPLAELPVEEGQGAWMQDGELSLPALFMQKLPRAGARDMIDNEEAIRYASEMGQLLDQEAVPLSRYMPGLRNVPDDANAVAGSNVGKGALASIARAMPDVVVAHKPKNKVLIFDPMGEKSPKEIIEIAKRASPSSRFRFAVSDPKIDRILMGRPEYADLPYIPPNPRTPEFVAREALELRSPFPSLNEEILRYGPERQSLD